MLQTYKHILLRYIRAMQIKETLLPAMRHPLVVSTSGSFTTKAEDFSPPAELDKGLIAGHPWGSRAISLCGVQTQYMVYDKQGRNVLSCCLTPELAAQWAIARLEREAKPPHIYNPRLVGMTFGHRAGGSSNLLSHTVLDESGALVAESVDGRASAAAEAVNILVSRVDCLDATADEFASTVVFAQVSKGVGSRSLPFVYDNSWGDTDQDAMASALRSIWRADPLLQQDDYGNSILRGRSNIDAFVGHAHASLLRHAHKMGRQINQIDLLYRGESLVKRFVFHVGLLNRGPVRDAMYWGYLQDARDAQTQPARLAQTAK